MAIDLGTTRINVKYLGGLTLNKIMLGAIEIFPNIASGVFTPADLFSATDQGVYSVFDLTSEQKASGLSGQAFKNAFPQARLYSDNTATQPVSAVGQLIGTAANLSKGWQQLAGQWEVFSGDATVVINGNSISVSGGTEITNLRRSIWPPVNSIAYCEIEVVSGWQAGMGFWLGNPSPVLAGKNINTGHNVGTGLVQLQFPAGGSYVVELGDIFHTESWCPLQGTGAARPVLTDSEGALFDAVDDILTTAGLPLGSEYTIAVLARASAGASAGNCVVASIGSNSTNFFSGGLRQDARAIRPQGRTSAAGQASGQGPAGSFETGQFAAAVYWTDSTTIFAENEAGQTATSTYPTPPFLGVANATINVAGLAGSANVIASLTVLEVVAINRILTPAERTQLLDYFSQWTTP